MIGGADSNMLDYRKLLRQAIMFKHDNNHKDWLALCNTLIDKDKTGLWYVPKDIKEFLLDPSKAWSMKDNVDHLLITTRHKVKSKFIPIIQLEDNEKIILKRCKTILPTYCMDIYTTYAREISCNSIAVVLTKYPEGYYLESITDKYEYLYYSTHRYKSRNYKDNELITKEKALELGFKVAKALRW